MKKVIPYLVCFAGVFTLLMIFFPKTLMLQESFALYLNTPDWKRDTFAGPWPLFHFAANWLLQFFHYVWGGPLILALLVTSVMMLLSIPFHGKKRQIFCWCFAGSVLLFGACLLNTKRVRAREIHSSVELAMLNYRWKEILKVATPETVKKNRDLLPYALLALTETGQLGSQMFNYPIESDDDFFPNSWYSCSQLMFGSMLYERMGSVNEAIHLITQAGNALPYGTSFGILRRLATLYRLQGNDTLADKYLYILGKSTLHAPHPQGAHPLKKFPLPLSSENENTDCESTSGNITYAVEPDILRSSQALVVHDEWFFNVTAMLSAGVQSPTLIDRSLCALLARRELERFVQMWNILPHAEGNAIPAHFREALLLADPATRDKASGPYTRYYQKGKH